MSNDSPVRDLRIERYNANARTIHWITAISFVLLALSGLALFHPALFWISALFGGGQWMRILHPFIGLVMFCAFSGLAIRYWHHNLIQFSDIQWLLRIANILQNQEEGLPEAGRYNGGQKMLFWTLLPCMITLLLSGIVLWRRYFSAYFPIDVIRFAALVHALVAFVLILAIMVHIYAGIWIDGTLGAMLHGYVTPGWARKHHPRWFRSIIKSQDLE
ncbi:Formate dehydrogenase, cytochrome b556(fdo) subunit [Paraburkholderia hiiakae]|uniref:Formate dehydrogenase, cytochrome b556(Fdo) subunit n=1 Tax=Paraburkholderia hiiakae TaxID=1081782 RepID=A0ABM8NN04_9BURK|nr:formate dehydrogenase subunit gamma [Paraburkholderia hiiakae]CAD6534089.1 Formate dehydrogenase, cytochrome b556(fdo) subunit [Paraburkholderia hiiakae]